MLRTKYLNKLYTYYYKYNINLAKDKSKQRSRQATAMVGPQDKQVITHYGPPTLLTVAQ